MSSHGPWLEPDPFSASFLVDVALRSDVGLTRSRNEDRAVVGRAGESARWDPPASARIDGRGLFALVCDGMGGEAGGDVASTVATEAIVASLAAAWPWESVERVLVASVVEAGERVRAAARAEPRHARMGTTATLAAFAPGMLVCAQVGDSRAYVVRAGRLLQVTHDQTMVAWLRASGIAIADEDAPTNVILQAVGSSTKLDVAITHTPLRTGDAVLLCSDGLSGVVDDEAIARVLATVDDPAAACDALVARANEAGGPDNVTCILARVRGL